MNWETAKKKLIEADPQLQIELNKLDLRYKVIRQILELRIKNNITQTELARRIKSTQSSIERLENGDVDPTIDKLSKIAEALDTKLEIRFIPKATH
jgi:predicted transcriptional regulator